MNILFEEEF